MLLVMKKPHTCGSSRTLCAALLMLLGVPAIASPIVFDLSNVTFQGGIAASGSLVFDSTTNAVTDVDVVITGPSSGFFNFFASGPVAFDTIGAQSSFPSHLNLILLPPGGSAAGDLSLVTAAGLSSTNPETVPFASSVLEINGTPTNDLQPLLTGSLVPEVPEPGTLGLVGLALAAIVRAVRRIA
jgi:hypothetical protein